MGNLADCGPKLCKFLSQDLYKGFFVTWQHGKTQEIEKKN